MKTRKSAFASGVCLCLWLTAYAAYAARSPDPVSPARLPAGVHSLEGLLDVPDDRRGVPVLGRCYLIVEASGSVRWGFCPAKINEPDTRDVVVAALQARAVSWAVAKVQTVRSRVFSQVDEALRAALTPDEYEALAAPVEATLVETLGGPVLAAPAPEEILARFKEAGVVGLTALRWPDFAMAPATLAGDPVTAWVPVSILLNRKLPGSVEVFPYHADDVDAPYETGRSDPQWLGRTRPLNKDCTALESRVWVRMTLSAEGVPNKPKTTTMVSPRHCTKLWYRYVSGTRFVPAYRDGSPQVGVHFQPFFYTRTLLRREPLEIMFTRERVDRWIETTP